MNIKILKIENSVKSKFNQLFSALNQRRCRKGPVLLFEDVSIEEEEGKMCRDSFYKYKRIISMICKITGKDIATFFQFLASTAQETPFFN